MPPLRAYGPDKHTDSKLPQLSPRQGAVVVCDSEEEAAKKRRSRSPNVKFKHGASPSPISSWPGNSSVALMSSPTNTRPKSWLLLEMESFLKRELAVLGDDELVPEVRLQIFKDCFQVFISHFTEYSSVLAQILKEFERAFQMQQDRIQNALNQKCSQSAKMERTSTALEVECTKARETIAQLRKEIGPLEHRLHRALVENETLKEELAAVRKELAVREMEQKEEYDRNKTLTTALREQAERQHRANTELKGLELEKNKHKNTVDHLTQQLQETIREREEKRKQEDQDQIQRLDHAVLDLKEENQEYRLRAKALVAQNFKLSTEMKALRQKYDRYVAAVRLENGRSMTPRPDWNKTFGEHVTFPPVEQRASSSECAKTVHDTIMKLKEEIKGIQCRATRAEVISKFMEDENIHDVNEIHAVGKHQRFFIGKGTHDSVPQYLRYHGKVKYIGITKGEVERAIKEIWQEKTTHKLGNQNHRDTPMSEFFYVYLLQKNNNNHDQAVEVAYNLVDTMERNRYDADLELFLKVLDGKVPEAVFYDQNKMVQSVKLMFAKLDRNDKGRVSRKACKSALLKLFPAKTHEDMLRVRYFLMMDQQGPWVEFKDLFVEDDDGNQGSFIECLRDQHLHEIQEYMVDVEQSLRHASSKSNGQQVSTINLSTVKQVIQEDDMDKPESEINSYIVRGINVNRVSEINWDEEVPVDGLVTNMQKGLMKRTGKRPEKQYIKKDMHDASFFNKSMFADSNGSGLTGRESSASFFTHYKNVMQQPLNNSMVLPANSRIQTEISHGSVGDARTNDSPTMSRQASEVQPLTLTPTPPPYAKGTSMSITATPPLN